MRRWIGIISLAMVTGCIPKPTQPAPQAFHVALAPAKVVQTAAAFLTAQGFEPMTSDADAGVLSMKRQRGPHGNAELLTCGVRKTSVADNNMTTAITISLVARAAQSGSDVTMTTHVLATYPTHEAKVWGLDDSDTICASNGVIEARVDSALAAGPLNAAK